MSRQEGGEIKLYLHMLDIVTMSSTTTEYYVSPNSTVHSLKVKIARNIDKPETVIRIFWKGKLLPKDANFYLLGIQENSTLEWEIAREEPEEWLDKRDRSTAILESAIKQITTDMNLAVYNLREVETLREVSDDDWSLVNQDHSVQMIKPFKCTPGVGIQEKSMEENIFEYHHLPEEYPSLNKMHIAFREAEEYLIKYLHLLDSDIKALEMNVEKLDTNERQISATVQEVATRTPLHEDHLESKRQKGVGASQFDFPTVETLEDSRTSNDAEIQKARGIIFRLLKEREICVWRLTQIDTRRKLWIFRDRLLGVWHEVNYSKLFGPSHLFELQGDFSTPLEGPGLLQRNREEKHPRTPAGKRPRRPSFTTPKRPRIQTIPQLPPPEHPRPPPLVAVPLSSWWVNTLEVTWLGPNPPVTLAVEGAERTQNGIFVIYPDGGCFLVNPNNANQGVKIAICSPQRLKEWLDTGETVSLSSERWSEFYRSHSSIKRGEKYPEESLFISPFSKKINK